MIISLITALYLFGIIDAQNAYTFLYVAGVLLIIGELVAGGHGLIALNGVIAFFVGYAIQTGNNMLFGIPVDWSVLFGLAFVEIIVLVVSLAVIFHYRKIKSSTGTESMVGKRATVISWSGNSGKVLIDGETWKAKSGTALELTPNEEVTVKAVDGLTLIISA